MAIEATVVDERALKSIAPPPKPEPEPPPPEPVPEPEPPVEEQGPPKPDQAEIERKREEERLAQEKLEQEKQAQEKQTQEKERLEAEKKEAEKLEAEKQAAAKAAAEKAAADKKARRKRRRTRPPRPRRPRTRKHARRAKPRCGAALEAEEQGNAVRNSAQANSWHAPIVAKIERAWIRPPSARPGVTCIVAVRQVPGRRSDRGAGQQLQYRRRSRCGSRSRRRCFAPRLCRRRRIRPCSNAIWS